MYIYPQTSTRLRRSGALGGPRGRAGDGPYTNGNGGGNGYIVRRGRPVPPQTNGTTTYPVDLPYVPPPKVCPSWGCGPMPPVVQPVGGPVWTPRPVVPITTGPLPPQQSTTPPTSTSPALPVPPGTPSNTTYTDANGNVWAMIGGNWVNTSAPGAGIPASAVPQSVAVNVSSSSGYQALLDWLTQKTLGEQLGLPRVPNWIFAGGGVLLALSLRGRRR